MRANRHRDTAPELALRSALHQMGLRFRVDVRPLPKLARRADLVFKGAKVAVFLNGCFWHACPVHGTWPKTNADWWRSKIEGNRERDTDTDQQLREAGWAAIRVWEHEDAEEAASAIAALVRARLSS